jgi:hypothetical protein
MKTANNKIHYQMTNPISRIVSSFNNLPKLSSTNFSMKTMLCAVALLLSIYMDAQVKIGNNPGSINANSLLEMESSNKGLLPPRVSLTGLSVVNPLTGTVPAGMLVYNTGSSLPGGYYYWSGFEWKQIGTAEIKLVNKTTSATLNKDETFVLAANDITLTLPAVTASDNGLAITIKNIGSHVHLVTVAASGGATIDGIATSNLTRYVGQTYVASNGNWIIKEAPKYDQHVLSVDETSSWTTLQEVMEFLAVHMTEAVVVRLTDAEYHLSETIVVDLPYPITFQSTSFGSSTIKAGAGLAGKPMFRCISECYFKMLQFDATSLTGYGTQQGEDAIRLVGNNTYHEIKDCAFDRFYNTILDSSNAELWLFECDISNAQKNGVLLHSNETGVKVRVSETDFINCVKGFNMEKGTGATIQMISGAYLNANATDTAIVYKPSGFTSINAIFITGNSWNHIGKYIEGFDFSRADGRDANVVLESNAGTGDRNPNCHINVLNNASSTNISTGGNWYKAGWTNTGVVTCKWTVNDNKITYQPANRRNGWMMISGNLSCNNANRTVSICIVKNGISTTRYGETTLRITTGSQPFQFSTMVYVSDIGPGDYFEVYATSNSSGDVLNFQDVLWLTNAQ